MEFSRDFIVEKLKILFPNLNTDPGSLADTVLIEPIVSILSRTDISNIEDFIITRVKEYDPSLIVTKGSAIYDVLIAPLASILEPIWKEIVLLREWKSLSNYRSMPYEEMDALAANYFVTRNLGARASGIARMYFSSPTSVMITRFSKFITKDGLVFYPRGTYSILSEGMSLNKEGELYYMDVEVEAEEEGEVYNIGPNQIISMDNSPAGYVKVTNPYSFTGGKSTETNEELYDRIANSITVRNLVTKKSIDFILREKFPQIEDLRIVGFGDPEMSRDLVAWGTDTVTTITKVISGDVLVTTDVHTVTGAKYIHTGGKTDIYVSCDDISEDYMDILNVTETAYNLSDYPPYGMKCPVLRIKSIERLDPVYLTRTGQYIPPARPIDARALRDFSLVRDLTNLERAVGTVRVFFERPTSFSVGPDTVFTAENGAEFAPIETQAVAATGMRLQSGQYISASEMETRIQYFHESPTYYYVDISVESLGVSSNMYLLNKNDRLEISNYTSEGWWIEATDETTSFSRDENIYLYFTSTFNDGIPIEGECVRITYEYSPTIRDIQLFVDDEDNRVVVTDTLVRSFLPGYVDMFLTYSGEIEPEDVVGHIESYITSLRQGEMFEISDIIDSLYNVGVSWVKLPIEVFVLLYDANRNTYSVRFDSEYLIPRKYHLYPRNIVAIRA